MQEKEKWIEEAMNSLHGMQKAGADPFLHTRIKGKLQNAVTEKVPVRWALASAVGFLFLLWMNVKVFTAGNNQQLHNSNGMEQVMQEYSLGNNNTYSYDSK